MNVAKLAQRYENFKNRRKNHSYLQMTDNTELIVECCKGVLTYDDNVIRLRLAAHLLTIIGESLNMRNYSAEGVMISGKIKSMEFDKEGV